MARKLIKLYFCIVSLILTEGFHKQGLLPNASKIQKSLYSRSSIKSLSSCKFMVQEPFNEWLIHSRNGHLVHHGQEMSKI